jgi:hypothetical protein
MRRDVAAAAFATALALASPARAEEDAMRWPDMPGGSLSFISENDKYAMRGDDKHYTNGLRLGWISAPVDRDGMVRRFADSLPIFDPAGEIRIGFAIGQSIFTPTDLEATQLITTDRPYAGWLYLAAALVGERFGGAGGAPDRLDTLELSLGVIGPSAGGQRVQNGWHGLIGVGDAEGWDNQIPDQPGVNLFYERKWRAASGGLVGFDPRLAVDVMPEVSASLGNILTYAGAGATLRFGRNLDVDWGPERIRPGLSGTGYVRRGDGMGWYLFAGFEGRAVAYNAFLDGPWFRASPDVDKKPLVGDFQAGLAFTWRGFRMAYTYVVRTPEFDGQDGADRFGAITLTASF